MLCLELFCQQRGQIKGRFFCCNAKKLWPKSGFHGFTSLVSADRILQVSNSHDYAWSGSNLTFKMLLCGRGDKNYHY